MRSRMQFALALMISFMRSATAEGDRHFLRSGGAEGRQAHHLPHRTTCSRAHLASVVAACFPLLGEKKWRQGPN